MLLRSTLSSARKPLRDFRTLAGVVSTITGNSLANLLGMQQEDSTKGISRQDEFLHSLRCMAGKGGGHVGKNRHKQHYGK